jgi:hypothetical protein
MVGQTVSEQGSNHGSSASSFSDISGKYSLIHIPLLLLLIAYLLFVDASLSASALESALMSNIRGGGGSRLYIHSSCHTWAFITSHVLDVGQLLHEVVS